MFHNTVDCVCLSPVKVRVLRSISLFLSQFFYKPLEVQYMFIMVSLQDFSQFIDFNQNKPLTPSSWMKKSPSARAQSLYSLAKGLEAKRRDLASSITVQTGLSLDEAEKEVELSIARLSDWAAYCDKVQGGALVRLFSILLYYTQFVKTSSLMNKRDDCQEKWSPDSVYILLCPRSFRLCHTVALLSPSLKLWESWGSSSPTAVPSSPW